MAYSVFGKIHDTDGNAVEGVVILPYFKKVDSGSDDSKWSDDTYSTDSDGYYSYSPEDDCLLGSEGVYKKNKDKFYCTYVLGGGESKDSLDLQQAMFHAHTIPNNDDIEINLTLEDIRTPLIDSSVMPDATLTQHEYTMSENSHADLSWKSADYGDDRSQKLLYDSVSIFDGHQVIDTLYRWDEIDERTVANSSSNKYSFKVAGDYTLGLTVREKWNTEVILSKDVRVKYNEPNVDFDWNPGALVVGNVEVTFTNNTTDLDDRSGDPYTYKWTIIDEDLDGNDTTAIVDNAELSDKPTHTFDSPGTKTIKLLCYWNDGFDDQTVEISRDIEVIEYDVSPAIQWNEPKDRDDEVTVTDATDDPNDVMKDWDITINDYYAKYNPDNENYGDDTTDNTITLEDNDKGGSVTHKFQSFEKHELETTVEYSTGWETKRKTVKNNINPSKYEVNAAIKQDGSLLGKVESTYTSNCSGDKDKMISETWSWDDVDLDDNSNVTTRDDADANSEQKFTYQYPSRKPYSAKDGSTEENKNKKVTLNVRYDDGWEDNKSSSSISYFEATTYEISMDINVRENIDGYTHG